MLRIMESEDDIAAPIVPEDKTKAEEVFRPRFGPDITRSISPGYRLCIPMLAQVAGV